MSCEKPPPRRGKEAAEMCDKSQEHPLPFDRSDAESMAFTLTLIIKRSGAEFSKSALPSDCDCCGKELIFDIGNFHFSVKRNPKDEYCLSVSGASRVKSSGFISDCPCIRDLFRCIEERIIESEEGGKK